MIYKHNFFAMGCQIFTAIESDSPKTVKRLEKVPLWFAEWENIFSRFKDDSELNQLNKTSGTPRIVSPTLWRVLKIAQEAYQHSDGLVSPTLLDCIEDAGYNQSFEKISFHQLSNNTRSITTVSDYRHIQMNESTRTVCLPTGMHLDLGGIVKGWAAEEAMQRLRIYGPTLVNAGGDLSISSLQINKSTWEIGITDPKDPTRNMGTLSVGRCGIATSGKDYRRWQQDGILKHHIIDPRTNQPAETDLLTVTIIAPSTIKAEIAAKVIFILGSEAGFEWLKVHHGLSGTLILDDGKILSNNNYLFGG